MGALSRGVVCSFQDCGLLQRYDGHRFITESEPSKGKPETLIGGEREFSANSVTNGSGREGRQRALVDGEGMEGKGQR